MSMIVALTAAAVTALSAPSADLCRPVEPTSAQRDQAFANAFARGPFALRTQAGRRACDFRREGQGRCELRDPRLVHVTVNGAHAWYVVPPGRNAQIDIAGDTAVCRLSPPR